MRPYYSDDSVTLYHGDALDVARTMPDGSADCIVTSPPYFGLRDYGTDGQYGLESTPGEYVETMRSLFRELKRVLANDGTLWLNLGDSYAGAGQSQGASSDRGWVRSHSSGSDLSGSASSASQNPDAYSLSAQFGQNPSYPSPNSENSSLHRRQETMASSVGPLADMKQGARDGNRRSRPRGYQGISAKSLIGIPWMVALGLQYDGWILRNDIIWHKPNAMPEPVQDRMASRHEHIFMFSKSKSYWFDLEAVRVPATQADRVRRDQVGGNKAHTTQHSPGGIFTGAATRNPGDVWEMPTQPFPGAHFAVFPVALPQRCILAGCKPGGTVLDPFSGSGTTGLAAQRTGRKYVGIDINAEYHELALRTRLQEQAFDFGTTA